MVAAHTSQSTMHIFQAHLCAELDYCRIYSLRHLWSMQHIKQTQITHSFGLLVCNTSKQHTFAVECDSTTWLFMSLAIQLHLLTPSLLEKTEQASLYHWLYRFLKKCTRCQWFSFRFCKRSLRLVWGVFTVTCLNCFRFIRCNSFFSVSSLVSIVSPNGKWSANVECISFCSFLELSFSFLFIPISLLLIILSIPSFWLLFSFSSLFSLFLSFYGFDCQLNYKFGSNKMIPRISKIRFVLNANTLQTDAFYYPNKIQTKSNKKKTSFKTMETTNKKYWVANASDIDVQQACKEFGGNNNMWIWM